MPFGDEKDTTRGGVTFRAVCAEFGLHPADCRNGMRHVPREVARKFRDRWEVLLYEASGVPRELEGRGPLNAVREPPKPKARPADPMWDDVLYVLPQDEALAISLNEIQRRLKLPPDKDQKVVKRYLRILLADGFAAETENWKRARERSGAQKQVRYFRVAA